MDGADLELFERSLRNATDHHTGADLDASLHELGWAEALDADPCAAVSRLFELQGAANVTSSALDLVVRGALDIATATRGVVLPALDGAAPPGSFQRDRLTVAGLGTSALVSHDTAVVVAHAAGDQVAAVVRTAELTLRPVRGIDPWLGLVEVSADSIAVAEPAMPVAGWAHAVSLARCALGHELVGASRSMLGQAREHALERIQFGQPISSFQAVRHRLAETLIAIETAEAALEAAWLDPSPHTAPMAKALAGRAARTAARHCQQVLAGIGFTTEHPLHLFIRRVLVLDELFGSARTLTRALGVDLLASRHLPPLLPL